MSLGGTCVAEPNAANGLVVDSTKDDNCCWSDSSSATIWKGRKTGRVADTKDMVVVVSEKQSNERYETW